MAANSAGNLDDLTKLLLEVQQTAQALKEKLTQAKEIIEEAPATELLYSISSITEVRETLTTHGAGKIATRMRRIELTTCQAKLIEGLDASTTMIAGRIDGPYHRTLKAVKGRLAVNSTRKMRQFSEDCRGFGGEQYGA